VHIESEEGVRRIPTGNWGGHQQWEGGKISCWYLGTSPLSHLPSSHKSCWAGPQGPLDALQSLARFGPQDQARARPKLLRSLLKKHPPVVLQKNWKQICIFKASPYKTRDQRGLIFRVEATGSTFGWGWKDRKRVVLVQINKAQKTQTVFPVSARHPGVYPQLFAPSSHMLRWKMDNVCEDGQEQLLGAAALHRVDIQQSQTCSASTLLPPPHPLILFLIILVFIFCLEVLLGP